MEADVVECIIERFDRRKVRGIAPAEERVQGILGIHGELERVVLRGLDDRVRQPELLLDLRPCPQHIDHALHHRAEDQAE